MSVKEKITQWETVLAFLISLSFFIGCAFIFTLGVKGILLDEFVFHSMFERIIVIISYLGVAVLAAYFARASLLLIKSFLGTKK